MFVLGNRTFDFFADFISYAKFGNFTAMIMRFSPLCDIMPRVLVNMQ